MGNVLVLNLLTGEEQLYTCDAITAVKSAYAHENNLGTQFAISLGEMDLPLNFGKHTVSCGDFTAILK